MPKHCLLPPYRLWLACSHCWRNRKAVDLQTPPLAQLFGSQQKQGIRAWWLFDHPLDGAQLRAYYPTRASWQNSRAVCLTLRAPQSHFSHTELLPSAMVLGIKKGFSLQSIPSGLRCELWNKGPCVWNVYSSPESMVLPRKTAGRGRARCGRVQPAGKAPYWLMFPSSWPPTHPLHIEAGSGFQAGESGTSTVQSPHFSVARGTAHMFWSLSLSI